MYLLFLSLSSTCGASSQHIYLEEFDGAIFEREKEESTSRSPNASQLLHLTLDLCHNRKSSYLLRIKTWFVWRCP